MAELKEKTKQEYRKRAAFFYKKYFSEEPPTPAKIEKALLDYADGKTETTWRFMRCALTFDQDENGYKKAAKKIKETPYPYQRIEKSPGKFVDPENSKRAPKRGYQKVLSQDDEDAMIQEAKRRYKMKNGKNRVSGMETYAALIVSRLSGVRPAELFSIKELDDGSFYIKSAKKTDMLVETKHAGKIFTNRGTDRQIKVDDKNHRNMSMAVEILQDMRQRFEAEDRGLDDCIKTIEDRVYELSRKIFPRRKRRPSLYTFRNQFASDMKAYQKENPDLLTDKEMAFMMGHVSTFSIRKYGKPGSGRAGRLKVSPGIDRESINTIVHDRQGQTDLQQFKSGQRPGSPDLSVFDHLPR